MSGGRKMCKVGSLKPSPESPSIRILNSPQSASFGLVLVEALLDGTEAAPPPSHLRGKLR